MPSNAIQLLVSVSTAVEARRAIDGGADIIDVKDPSVGPLGFAGADAIQVIQQAVGGRVPVSAALGECSDWPPQDAAAAIAACHGLHFVKLGLAGTIPEGRASSPTRRSHVPTRPADWAAEWRGVRLQFSAAFSARAAPLSVPSWVAVAYADHEKARAPAVVDILEAATNAGCSTLLIDTWHKDGSGTLSWLTVAELLNIRRETRKRGLQLALAGQLTDEHLPQVKAIVPDIFAVRGAVCEGRDRTAMVNEEKVTHLKRMLRQS